MLRPDFLFLSNSFYAAHHARKSCDGRQEENNSNENDIEIGDVERGLLGAGDINMTPEEMCVCRNAVF